MTHPKRRADSPLGKQILRQPLHKRIQNFGWRLTSFIPFLGLTWIASGSIPSQTPQRITRDQVIYDEKVSEIKVAKQGPLDVDQEIARLNQIERSYNENLSPLQRRKRLARDPRISSPRDRILREEYRYSRGPQQPGKKSGRL